VERMIRRASPLPAPPPELAGDPVELVVPVRFSLR
jgi:periplasmic protein TonB